MYHEIGAGSVFKGQVSHVYLEAVSSGAEVVVDEPDALPLLLCYRLMVDKTI